MLSWLVEEEGIAPHIRVNDNSKRRMAASRAATFDMIRQTTFSPADKTLTTTGAAERNAAIRSPRRRRQAAPVGRANSVASDIVHWVEVKNRKAPAVTREAEED